MENIVENGFKISKSDLLAGQLNDLHGFFKQTENNITALLKGKLFNTDLSSLLKDYLQDGNLALQKADGDFLLIIVEKDKLRFFRDRHGAGSQLFYTTDFFTSHLICFTDLEGFNCKPKQEALFTFLSIGYIPSPMTALKGVSKLSSGHLLTLEKGKLQTTDLFGYEAYMKQTATTKLSLEEATAKYEELHKKAISDRIKNTTKVGLLLSGGYDSGGNISALRDICQGDVVSYSIGFKNNPWTELPLAKILSEKYGSKHFEYEIDGSEIMDLPQILKATGDPFQEGGLMVNYTAMRLVQDSGENPEVILGGDGNDQHFGTSGKELAMHWKLKSKGLQAFQKLYDVGGNILPMFEKDNILFRSQFHNRKILHIQQSDMFGFQLKQLSKLSADGFKIEQFSYLKDHPHQFSSFDEFFFNRNFNIDIKQVINEVILYKSSRMSELFGNRMTFPYMSTDLYNFLSQMPVEYKFRGSLDDLAAGKGKSKFLHKNYLRPKLPSEITDRKKQGGFAPLPIFIRDDKQRKQLFDYLRRSDMVNTLLHSNVIESLLAQYEGIAQSPAYWFWFRQVKANQIINLLTLAVWWDMFIGKKTSISNISEL